MRLTRQIVASLVPIEGKPYYIEWDEALPGFGVRVNPSNKVWVVQYRLNGKSRRETIGRIGILPLDQAREIAKTKLAKAQLGENPNARQLQQAQIEPLFGQVATRYLAQSESRLKPRSFAEVKRNIEQKWALFWTRPLASITRAEIATRLEEIAKVHGRIAGNRARSSLSTLFSFAIGTGLVEANPVIGTFKPAEEKSRENVLSDRELSAVWRACRNDDYGRIVKLLALTGQRRDEVGQMTWSEVDLAECIWSIPPARTKNGRAHEVPLSSHAIAILASIPRQFGRDRIFGQGAGGYSGWSRSKLNLDGRIDASGVAVRAWRLHDLRRTVATALGDMGVLPHVIEAILNHVSGHKAGVAGIYNRASYNAEKRIALDQWGERVASISAD